MNRLICFILCIPFLLFAQVEVVSLGEFGSLSYAYDQGQLLYIDRLDPAGEILYSHCFYYNRKGKVIDEKIFSRISEIEFVDDIELLFHLMPEDDQSLTLADNTCFVGGLFRVMRFAKPAAKKIPSLISRGVKKTFKPAKRVRTPARGKPPAPRAAPPPKRIEVSPKKGATSKQAASPYLKPKRQLGNLSESPQQVTADNWKPPLKPPYCGKKLGSDPKRCPGEGYVWKGNGPPESAQGSWVRGRRPNHEVLHPDLKHGDPIGPHWDYWGPGWPKKGIRIKLDGTWEYKR